jgi:hypothetical protein
MASKSRRLFGLESFLKNPQSSRIFKESRRSFDNLKYKKKYESLFSQLLKLKQISVKENLKKKLNNITKSQLHSFKHLNIKKSSKNNRLNYKKILNNLKKQKESDKVKTNKMNYKTKKQIKNSFKKKIFSKEIIISNEQIDPDKKMDSNQIQMIKDIFIKYFKIAYKTFIKEIERQIIEKFKEKINDYMIDKLNELLDILNEKINDYNELFKDKSFMELLKDFKEDNKSKLIKKINDFINKKYEESKNEVDKKLNIINENNENNEHSSIEYLNPNEVNLSENPYPTRNYKNLPYVNKYIGKLKIPIIDRINPTYIYKEKQIENLIK